MTLSLSAIEAKVEQYIQDGHNEKAFELIYQLAVASANKGLFQKSEAYRDRLYEVDSDALSRIIAVNEVIEKQKSKFIPPEYRILWAPFFKTLTEEDANAFFLALKKVKVDSEEIILGQGQQNDRLFLVQQGQLKAVYIDKQKELLLRRLDSGDVFGEDTFFSVNVCTATIITQTPVHLSFIQYADLKRLQKKHESLRSNLEKICTAGRSLTAILRKKGIDRRSSKRFNLRRTIRFQLLESDNPKALHRSVAAEMWDISKRGLSFYFQSKNREAVRKLIGRPLGLKFSLNINGADKTVVTTGIVQGVESHPLDEYSVHLQLNRPFHDDVIRAIARLAT